MEEDNRGLTRKICYSSASRGVVGVLCPGMEKFCFVFFFGRTTFTLCTSFTTAYIFANILDGTFSFSEDDV